MLLGERHLGRSVRAHHRRRRDRAARAGFTYVELLVALGIVTVLMALVLPVIGRVKSSANAVRCQSNLHHIAQGFQHYAMNNGGRLPDPLALDQSWERFLQSYVAGADAFRCPADEELIVSLGSSYDWRDTGDASTTLAGANFAEAKPDTVIAYDALPNWHAKGKMNAARADGSATSMDTRDCLGNIMTPLRAKAP